jgi:hypothetical protein
MLICTGTLYCTAESIRQLDMCTEPVHRPPGKNCIATTGVGSVLEMEEL